MFDSLMAGTAGTCRAFAVDAWRRVENAACARRIAAMVDMLDAAHAAAGSVDRDQWCLDNWGAVSAHVGAVQRITAGVADGMLLVGVALRDRFPKVGALFAAGEIGYSVVRSLVTRTLLVTDPDARRELDGLLAEALASWGPMSVASTEKAIDAIIAAVDPRAVRRTLTRARGRHVDVVVDGDGMATLAGLLFAPDALALDQRLSALADTVCPADPRTRDQRRADAAGLPRGADRLACLCGTEDCPAGALPPSASGVVVYVVAHQDTIADPATSEAPAGPVSPTPDAPTPEPTDEPAERESPSPNHPPAPEVIAPAAECAGLDGPEPAMFDKPLHDLTWAELTAPTPGQLSQLRPGYLMAGAVLPGAVSRRAALNATLVPILHPGQAPPEPRYTPSKKLADFVRSRDLTCRFPGCHHPATACDVDHTIPYPYGSTCASNLKCLCRFHHLLKTFWGGPNGWRDIQHPRRDGGVDRPRWPHPHHDTRQSTAVSGTVRTDRARRGDRDTAARAHQWIEDAQTPPHPRAGPRASHPGRTRPQRHPPRGGTRTHRTR
jgi:hypothetical protein